MDLETVGRWVGDKIDWLTDEQEDWTDPVKPPLRAEPTSLSSRTRPPDAISRQQLASGFNPLIKSAITNVLTALPLTALPRLNPSIHLLTLTTTLLQPTLSLPTN